MPSFMMPSILSRVATPSCSAKIVQLARRSDALDDRALLFRRQTFFVHVALQTAVNRGQTTLQKLIRHIAHHDLVARTRAHLCDAAAHRPRADHTDHFSHYRST